MQQYPLELKFTKLNISDYQISNNFEVPEQCQICYKSQQTKIINVLTAEFKDKPILEILEYFPDITEYRLIEDILNLCLGCVKQLILSYLFLVKLKESNKKFKGLIKISAKIVKPERGIKKDNQISIQEEIKIYHDIEETDCTLQVQSKTEDLSCKLENKKITDVNIGTDFVGDPTSSNEYSSDSLEPKKKDEHGTVESVEILVDDFNKIEENGYKCDICHIEFVDTILLKSHLKEVHTKEELTCSSSKIFQLPIQLKRHLINVHDLNSHGNSITKLRKINCEVCGKYFNKYVLKSHMERHSENKKHKCDICGQAFFQLQSLNNHKIRHQDPKFTCDYCGKLFFTKQEMQTHVRRHHTREIVCTCQYCGKGFVHKTNLVQHIRNCHNGEKYEKLVEPKVPKQCNECGNIYSSRTSLFHHRKRAHENKLYPCTKCDKKFRNLVPLKSHLKKVHDIGETNICDICQKPYSTKEELYRHKKRTHNTSTNSLYLGCTVCKIKFKIKHELIQHIQNEHLKSVDPSDVPVLFECNICVTFFMDFENFHSHLFANHIKSVEKIFVTEYMSGGFKIQSFTQQRKCKGSK